MIFKIYQTADEKWIFRFETETGSSLFISKRYNSRSAARRAIQRVKRNAANAEIVE